MERITGADDAKDGSAYLRLSDGAQTHQPNPATAGQTVTATLWLRGGSDADTAELTLDFRDQTMWTPALQSETTTVTLTTEWAEYTVSATAPEVPDNPVFQTRLSIASGDGSTVEVDALSQTTE